jgi:cytochrome c5
LPWRYARSFVEQLPFHEMEPMEWLVKGAGTILLLPVSVPGAFELPWDNPRTGGFVGEPRPVAGGGKVGLGVPPSDPREDWASAGASVKIAAAVEIEFGGCPFFQAALRYNQEMFVKLMYLIVGALLAQSRTVWDGVYTEAQAERGKIAYEANCVTCHKTDLTGIEGALKGEQFFERRREDNLDAFYSAVKTMPPRKAGSLSNDIYLDIMSYALQANGIPSGSAELELDALAKVRVIRKDGPAPVPTSSPVLVVGCIQAGPNDTWQLVNATEPVRTRGQFVHVPEELAVARSTSPGTLTFRLQDAEYLDTKPIAGQKAQAKGTLVRAPAGNRIIVSLLETVAAACP